jgi:hypothetical protein
MRTGSFDARFLRSSSRVVPFERVLDVVAERDRYLAFNAKSAGVNL